MYRSILVPVDGSAFAEHALPLALAIARRANAAIHLVRVSAPLTAAALDGAGVNLVELEQEVKRGCQEYLDRTMAALRRRTSVPLSSEVIVGDIAPTLCYFASGGRHDLVVMATHGRSPFGRFWLGSVADQVLRHVAVPLLLVRPGDAEANLDAEPSLGTIVLPLDGTPLAEQILEPAATLAALMPGTELLLIRAIPAVGPEDAADVADTHAYREAAGYLGAVAAVLKARGLAVRTHVVFEDRPAEAILHEAEGAHAGAIALETRGEGGLARLLHGSVADAVIRGAHVPVLVCRPVNA
jgi:nucleotide-binding universal stress UspA family protein